MGGSWLSFALELAVVPRYPSRGAPCWTADVMLLVWAAVVMSGWLKKAGDQTVSSEDRRISGDGEQVSDLQPVYT